MATGPMDGTPYEYDIEPRRDYAGRRRLPDDVTRRWRMNWRTGAKLPANDNFLCSLEDRYTPRGVSWVRIQPQPPNEAKSVRLAASSERTFTRPRLRSTSVRWLKSGSRVVDYRPGFEPWPCYSWRSDGRAF